MKKKAVKEYFNMTIGVILVVIGVYFFKFPNHFSIGGVTGAAILVQRLSGGAISSSTLVLVLNMLLLLIGLLVLGKEFGLKTAYGTILMSGLLKLLEAVYPMNQPFTDEPLLELFFAVMLPAVGAAILFNYGGSTGGTDVVAMILKKYINTNIGRALLYVDLSLTLAVFPIFGIKTGLLALTGLVLKSLVIDNMIESMNLCKYFTVICDNPQPISRFILDELHRSATIYDARGAYTGSDKKVILVVMDRIQAVKLRTYIKEIEPTAFILITNTSEIIGRGFRS